MGWSLLYELQRRGAILWRLFQQSSGTCRTLHPDGPGANSMAEEPYCGGGLQRCFLRTDFFAVHRNSGTAATASDSHKQGLHKVAVGSEVERDLQPSSRNSIFRLHARQRVSKDGTLSRAERSGRLLERLCSSRFFWQ